MEVVAPADPVERCELLWRTAFFVRVLMDSPYRNPNRMNMH
jgi:hypothetical protein